MKNLHYTILILFSSIFLFSCDNSSEDIEPIEEVPLTPEQIAQAALSDVEFAAFKLINEHRESMGVQPLEHHQDTYDLALEHSINMANGTVPFSHNGFDDRLSRLRINHIIPKAGENVAANNLSNPANIAFQGWLESAGHRRNMEDVDFTHGGIAVSIKDNGVYYFTHFLVKINQSQE